MMKTCRICKCSDDHPVYSGQEVRLGLGDIFSYFCCNQCGCLQIEEIPSNIQKYYENYYSLKNNDGKDSLLKRLLRKQLFKYRLNGRNILGKTLANYSPEAFDWIEPKMFSFNSSILDVGAGNGRLLQKMFYCGFPNVHGIDPFIENDLEFKIGKKILQVEKKDLPELNSRYDVIMLHHVLEHIADQDATFEHLVKLMHAKSILIILIPMMSEYIWQHFGMNGFQLADCPRHYYIHTRKSLFTLTEKYGLELLSEKYLGNQGIDILKSVDGKRKLYESDKDRKEIVSSLIDKKDTGLACFYFKRNDS